MVAPNRPVRPAVAVQVAATTRDNVPDRLLHGTPINPEHTVEARLEQWRERLGDSP
jgi:hypothetical protein